MAGAGYDGKLEAVTLGTEFTIQLPRGWERGRDRNGCWWCENPERNCTLFLQAESFEEDGAGIAPYMDKLIDFLKSQEMTREIRIFPLPGGELVRAVVDHVEEGRLIRTFRWYSATPVDGQIALVRWTLALDAARSEEPEMRQLVELFEGQARGAEPGVGPAFSNDNSPPRPAASTVPPPTLQGEVPGSGGGKYGLDRLKRIDCFGFITLRVPERWSCDRDESGMWGCYEEGEETGTLWVDYDLCATTATSDETLIQFRDMLFREVAEGVSEFNPEIREDVLYFEDDDASEDGAMLRHHRWHLVREAGGKALVLIQIALVLPHSLLGEAEFRNLVHLMDREVRDLQLSGLPQG